MMAKLVGKASCSQHSLRQTGSTIPCLALAHSCPHKSGSKSLYFKFLRTVLDRAKYFKMKVTRCGYLPLGILSNFVSFLNSHCDTPEDSSWNAVPWQSFWVSLKLAQDRVG